MESAKALLIDLIDFLDRVEGRIMNNKVDLTDFFQIIHFKHCFNTMDSMLKQCEKSVSTQQLNEIKARIKMARETVEMLEECACVENTDEVYGDMYLTDQSNTEDDDYDDYGKHLGISNEEFDNLVEEWAEDRDTSERVHRKKRESKNVNFQDQIKGELAQLADSMKSKAMKYRDILVSDNKALLKFTGEQEKQLDTVTHVAKESAKLEKSTSITVWQYVAMLATLVICPWIIILLFTFT